jgi:hypothetical protein
MIMALIFCLRLTIAYFFWSIICLPYRKNIIARRRYNMSEKEQIVQGSYPPWSRIPSVEEMAAEVGIDGAEFLHSLGSGLDLEQLAEKFEVSPKTIEHLYDHFMHYGVGSIMGGD